MDDQKRWIQKASLRPGHHSDPRPRPPPLLQAIVPPAKHPPPCLGPRCAGVPLTALSFPSPMASNLTHANWVGGNPFVFDRSAGREPCEIHAGVLWHGRGRYFRVHSQVLPSCGICPPAAVIAPRTETPGPGQCCKPFPSQTPAERGSSRPLRGPVPPYTGGRFWPP